MRSNLGEPADPNEVHDDIMEILSMVNGQPANSMEKFVENTEKAIESYNGKGGRWIAVYEGQNESTGAFKINFYARPAH